MALSTAVTSSRGRLSDVGVAGLWSAGRTLALRLTAQGVRVSLWDPEGPGVEAFVSQNAGTRGGLVGYSDREDFAESVRSPRRIAVFETLTSTDGAALRSLLRDPDRLLECPVIDNTIPSTDLELIELTLLFQLA